MSAAELSTVLCWVGGCGCVVVAVVDANLGVADRRRVEGGDCSPWQWTRVSRNVVNAEDTRILFLSAELLPAASVAARDKTLEMVLLKGLEP